LYSYCSQLAQASPLTQNVSPIFSQPHFGSNEDVGYTVGAGVECTTGAGVGAWVRSCEAVVGDAVGDGVGKATVSANIQQLLAE
jgi:hypothetical protein